MKSIRDDAPYVPSNVDFVAANNGLAGRDDVRAVLMEASYTVLGLGGASHCTLSALHSARWQHHAWVGTKKGRAQSKAVLLVLSLRVISAPVTCLGCWRCVVHLHRVVH